MVGRRILLLAPLLGACTELTTPRPPEPPLDLVGRVTANPTMAILDAAAADFAEGGARLLNRPAATALAVARLEWIGGEFRPGRRLARLPDSYMFATRRAVAEGREALGILPETTPEAAVAALVIASRALTRGDPAAVQVALASPIFVLPGARPVVSRLTEPGAFPDASLAITALHDEVARQVALLEVDHRMMVEGQIFGNSTTGLGPGTGY